MADVMEKKIEKIKNVIQDKEKQFQSDMKLFLRDHNLSDDERKTLNRVRVRIDALKKKVAELDAERGVVNFDDTEPVIVKTEKKLGKAKYFTDSDFKAKFDGSIKNWAQDGAISLNQVRIFMIKEDDPAGLTIADILKVVTVVFPPAQLIATAVDLGTITEKAFNTALKARSTKPSLNQIQNAWAEALTQMAKADHSSAYDKFVTDWKKKNNVPKDADKIWSNLFNPACVNFANDHMPSSKDVQKAFLGKILSGVEDSYDWDSKAGYADIQLIELAGSFSQPKGQLDDVPEQLLKAIKTVWRGALVIDLPVEVKFTIHNSGGTELAEINRSSHTPGNTSFSLKSGDKFLFGEFMKKKAYKLPRITDLKVDGI